MAIFASSKDVDLLLNHEPICSLSDLYLVFHDQEILREYLIYLMTSIIENSEPGTEIEISFEYSDAHPSSETKHKNILDMYPHFDMKVTWIFRYMPIVRHARYRREISEFYQNKLFTNTGRFTEENTPNFKVDRFQVACFGVKYSCTKNYLENAASLIHFPFDISFDQLLSFSETIHGQNVVLVSGAKTKFMEEIAMYLETWKVHVSSIFGEKDAYILKKIRELEIEFSQESSKKRGDFHIILTDDIENLEFMIKAMVCLSKFDRVIIVSKAKDLLRARLLLDHLRSEMSELYPIVKLTSKPCGPERLLFLMHEIRAKQEGMESGAAQTFGKTSKSLSSPETIRILIVEDNAINITILSNILDHLGFKYEKAYNGLEALENFVREPYQVILIGFFIHPDD